MLKAAGLRINRFASTQMHSEQKSTKVFFVWNRVYVPIVYASGDGWTYKPVSNKSPNNWADARSPRSRRRLRAAPAATPAPALYYTVLLRAIILTLWGKRAVFPCLYRIPYDSKCSLMLVGWRFGSRPVFCRMHRRWPYAQSLQYACDGTC